MVVLTHRVFTYRDGGQRLYRGYAAAIGKPANRRTVRSSATLTSAAVAYG